jgi:hypothetical protein
MTAVREKHSHVEKTTTALPLDQELARATEAIRAALKGLEPGSRLELNQVVGAFSALERVNHLRTKRLSGDEKSQQEVSAEAMSRYRAMLTQWANQLPRIYGWLLTERSRLASRRVHTQAVETWMKMDRETR